MARPFRPKGGMEMQNSMPISGHTTKVITTAVNYTVVAADSHKIIKVTGVDKVITLPPTIEGMEITVLVTTAALSAGTGTSISPNAADNIRGNGLTAVDNKDLINSGATDRDGDMVTLVGDGVDGWYIKDIIGTWAKEA